MIPGIVNVVLLNKRRQIISPASFGQGGASNVFNRGKGLSTRQKALTGAVQHFSSVPLVINFIATWSPTDNVGMTLSGSNLIATPTGNFKGVRCNTGFSSGKKYFELTPDAAMNSEFIGLALSSTSLSAGGTSNAIGVNSAGAIFVNGVSQTQNVGSLGGAAVAFAVDLTNSLIWIKGNAGFWNGSSSNTGDPVAGTGGIDISGISGTLYPLFESVVPTGLPPCTANFGASTFSYTVPTGFIAGWG